MRKTVVCFAATLCLALTSSAHAGDCQVFVGSTGYQFSGTTASNPVKTSESMNNAFNHHVCGRTVYSLSGTCYLQVTDSDSVASGNCLTLGKGVVVTSAPVNGANPQLTCTTNNCGYGIAYTSSGVNSTSVEGVDVRGCFSRGASGSTGWNTFSDSTVDLATTDPTNYPTCSSSTTYGVIGFNVLDHMKIRHSTNYAAAGDVTVRDSIISECGIGITATNPTVIDNVLFDGNTTSVYRSTTGGSINGSVMLNSSCHCKVGTTCSSDITQCVTPTGNTTIVDGDFYD